jgi:hypothetical protein
MAKPWFCVKRGFFWHLAIWECFHSDVLWRLKTAISGNLIFGGADRWLSAQNETD